MLPALEIASLTPLPARRGAALTYSSLGCSAQVLLGIRGSLQESNYSLLRQVGGPDQVKLVLAVISDFLGYPEAAPAVKRHVQLWVAPVRDRRCLQIPGAVQANRRGAGGMAGICPRAASRQGSSWSSSAPRLPSAGKTHPTHSLQHIWRAQI